MKKGRRLSRESAKGIWDSLREESRLGLLEGWKTKGWYSHELFIHHI
jgi:hypothetical protein